MRIRHKLSYANVTATIALFLVLGGGAYAAKKNLINTKDIANQAVTGKKVAKKTIKAKNLKPGKGVTGAVVKDATLGGADITDGGLAGVDITDASVPGAKLTNGSVATAKLVGEEDVHVLGDSGEPALGNGVEGDCVWSDGQAQIPGLNPAGFRIDRFGTVHLSGLIASEESVGVGDEECGGTTPEPDDYVEDGIAFTLPAAYRPANAEVRLASTTSTLIIAGEDSLFVPPDVVLPAGSVFVGDAPTAGLLDGVSFKAASAGVFARASAGKRSVEKLNSELAKQLGL